MRRPPVPRKFPCHVTLRIRPGIPSLRTQRFVHAFRASLEHASERKDFRVVHYSVQRDHVHMLVEAAGKEALGAGMKAVGSRLAHVVKRVHGIRGRVMDGRYHLRVLSAPREVQAALAYIKRTQKVREALGSCQTLED